MTRETVDVENIGNLLKSVGVDKIIIQPHPYFATDSKEAYIMVSYKMAEEIFKRIPKE